jgi:hypothetical protein
LPRTGDIAARFEASADIPGDSPTSPPPASSLPGSERTGQLGVVGQFDAKNKYCFGIFDPEFVCSRMYEVTLEKTGRSRWWWRVQDRSGKAIMTGWKNSRGEAKYQGERALFLLLVTMARI